MSPFFSIIIPVYNVAPYLRECLDSVLAQTFPDWEAICVDDGSTDGSGAILDEYAAKDRRFRVIRQPNAGVGAARNEGLNIAKGNWILFLDADDVWQHNLLSTVVSMIKAHPDKKLFRFGYECFKDKFNVNQIDRAEEGCTVIDISKEISMHDFFFFFFCCYAYRRDVFDGIRFPRYIRGEDRCVLNKIQLERADFIVATGRKLYGYRSRPGSAMHSIPSLQVLRDEMDHRLDMIEMIDSSAKHVDYSKEPWVVPYFLSFPKQIGYRWDAILLWDDWKLRIQRLSRAHLISKDNQAMLRRRYKCPTKWWFLLGFILRVAFAPIRKLWRFVLRHGEFSKQ